MNLTRCLLTIQINIIDILYKLALNLFVKDQRLSTSTSPQYQTPDNQKDQPVVYDTNNIKIKKEASVDSKKVFSFNQFSTSQLKYKIYLNYFSTQTEIVKKKLKVSNIEQKQLSNNICLQVLAVFWKLSCKYVVVSCSITKPLH